MDAEYFQRKYDHYHERLSLNATQKGWKFERLKELANSFCYGTSTKLEYLEQGIPFLRIADITGYRFLNEKLKFISSEAALKEKSSSAKEGDVIISRSGTLGLSIEIPKELENAIFGSYFIRTSPNPKRLNSTYLALYMNSLSGKIQVERTNTGGIQTNLTLPVIQNFKIVCPPLKIQEKLIGKVTESFRANDESRKLLELAKQIVERAIETSEEEALSLIEHKGLS